MYKKKLTQLLLLLISFFIVSSIVKADDDGTCEFWFDTQAFVDITNKNANHVKFIGKKLYCHLSSGKDEKSNQDEKFNQSELICGIKTAFETNTEEFKTLEYFQNSEVDGFGAPTYEIYMYLVDENGVKTDYSIPKVEVENDLTEIPSCPDELGIWFVAKENIIRIYNISDEMHDFICEKNNENNPCVLAESEDNPTPPNPPKPYKYVEKCEDADPINYIRACGCIPAGVADISSKVYYILRVIGPIILIIIGGIEMAKAVSSQDESAIEKSKKKLVNKAIAAAMIFLVLTIVKFGISIVRDQNQTKGIYECVDYLLDGYEI